MWLSQNQIGSLPIESIAKNAGVYNAEALIYRFVCFS